MRGLKGSQLLKGEDDAAGRYKADGGRDEQRGGPLGRPKCACGGGARWRRTSWGANAKACRSISLLSCDSRHVGCV